MLTQLEQESLDVLYLVKDKMTGGPITIPEFTEFMGEIKAIIRKLEKKEAE